MKARWKIFLYINILVIASFSASLLLELLQLFLSRAILNTPLMAILFIAGFSAITFFNCGRNISLCRVITHNKRDITINTVHTRNLTALFSIVIILLGYGLIRGSNSFRFSFYTRNILNIAAYCFQAIAVLSGIYTVFQQSTLSKLVAGILDREINNSIEEIGA